MAITPVATAEEIKKINGTSLPDPSYTPFILAAACAMESIVACTSSKAVDSECLVASENWLAAHFMALTPIGDDTRIKKSERFENYTTEWAMSTLQGNGILSTTYGVTANTLTGGCLQDVDKAPALLCSFG